MASIKSNRNFRNSSVYQLSIQDIPGFLKTFTSQLKPGTIIGLSGELGAGKTTFVQQLGAILGVKKRITSPTFTLMNTYHGTLPATRNPITLCHIDAYRLAAAAHLDRSGILEHIQQPDTISCIEWIENIQSQIPKPDYLINLSNPKI